MSSSNANVSIVFDEIGFDSEEKDTSTEFVGDSSYSITGSVEL